MMDGWMNTPAALLCFYFVVQALGKANHQPPVVSELTVTNTICDDETDDDDVDSYLTLNTSLRNPRTWLSSASPVEQQVSLSLFSFSMFAIFREPRL